jgi:hypothetical protein
MKNISLKIITILVILIIVLSPILNSSVINIKRTDYLNNNQSNLIDYISDSEKINLAILQSKPDGSINITTKEIIYDEYRSLIYEITNKISKTKTGDKPFLTIFKLLREKNLIKQDVVLNELLGDKISNFSNTTAYNLSIMQPFVSMFAPIIAVGMGFGGGIGDKFGSITGLLYSGGIIGLGAVLCLDALIKTIYVQFTFTFPLLLHILASFVGIIMFPVDFDFISANFLPLFIYSNFIAIGYSALAIGVPLGYY